MGTGSAAGAPQNAQSERVLIVDDERDVLETLVDILKDQGFSPVATSDSRHAVTLLDATPFELVITDVVMPYLDGLQILELARSRNPDVQVLLVTAYATRELAIEAMNKGAAGLLEKPFDLAQIQASVREALRRSRLRRSTAAGD